MTSVSFQREIRIVPGCQPATDKTAFDTGHLVNASGIRFENGRIKKRGGHTEITFDEPNDTITGTARSLFSTIIGTKTYSTIGTNTRLYSLVGTQLTNVTPLQTTTNAIANSLATDYATLGNNPATTTNGSKFVVIADTGAAAKYQVLDSYTLSGFPGDLNGIPQAQLNTTHTIRALGTDSVTIAVTTAATSSGSGGSNAVVRATGLVRVTAASHGQSDGDRTKIASSANFGGIVAATQMNAEHIIRNVAAGTFDVMTAGTASSSVSTAGGASTTYQKQIAAGLVNETFGQGYGAGRYGLGLYGTALTTTSGRVLPRVWFFDKYGANIIATAGNQTGVYTWAGATTTAPALVANAPTAVNYAFVSDNILVTLGAGGTENRVFASDQGDITNWTGSSTNSVFDDNIEGAGKLISHTPAGGLNLLHAELRVYTFRKIPRDSGVWEIKLLDAQAGLISAQARISVDGIAFWMGHNNFYMWRGGKVEVVPANTQAKSTLQNYVFDDMERGQKSKIFCWYNERYKEIWWHYPSAGSNEPNRVARLNVGTFEWVMDTIDRTGAEYPNISLINPRLLDTDTLYRHENGLNDSGSALSWTFRTPKYTVGKNNQLLSAIIPDSIQTGDITLVIRSYEYPMSTTPIQTETYTITSTTGRLPINVFGRFWDYTFSGSSVDGNFEMGRWFEELQGASII